MSTRRVAAIGLAGILVLTAGCLVGGSSKTYRSGNYVSDQTFSQIEAGKTTAGWVLATLGEPTERTKVDDGNEIWKYSYTETKDSSGYVFLLFGGSDSDTKTQNAFVQVDDGIVTKSWRD